jgi:hypothetical protein
MLSRSFIRSSRVLFSFSPSSLSCSLFLHPPSTRSFSIGTYFRQVFGSSFSQKSIVEEEVEPPRESHYFQPEWEDNKP